MFGIAAGVTAGAVVLHQGDTTKSTGILNSPFGVNSGIYGPKISQKQPKVHLPWT